MKITVEKKDLSDIEKVEDLLFSLGFVCNSYSSSQNLIYSKKEDIVIIKNKKR